MKPAQYPIMNKTILGILCVSSSLVLGTVACKKSDKPSDPQPTSAKPTEPTGVAAGTPAPTAPTAPAGAGWRSIPNAAAKLEIDAPATWLDNGIGGAAGMHIEGGADFMINEMSPDDAAKKLAEIKTDAEAMLFQKWITAEEKDGVTKLLFNMDKITMKGDEPVKDGTLVSFEARSDIGGKKYKCYGSAPDQAGAQEGLDLCLRVRLAP